MGRGGLNLFLQKDEYLIQKFPSFRVPEKHHIYIYIDRSTNHHYKTSLFNWEAEFFFFSDVAVGT